MSIHCVALRGKMSEQREKEVDLFLLLWLEKKTPAGSIQWSPGLKTTAASPLFNWFSCNLWWACKAIQSANSLGTAFVFVFFPSKSPFHLLWSRSNLLFGETGVRTAQVSEMNSSKEMAGSRGTWISVEIVSPEFVCSFFRRKGRVSEEG